MAAVTYGCINNDTFSQDTRSSPPGSVISDHVAKILMYIFASSASSCLSVLGLGANVLNVIIYAKQGIKDSVTVHLLSLAVIDMLSNVLILLSALSEMVAHVKPNLTDFDPMSFIYVLSVPRRLFYAMSIIVTSFLSIERCFCIIFPFKVKSLFTKHRTTVATVTIVLVGLTCLVPETLTGGMHWSLDIRFNRTRLLLWIAPNRESVDLPLSIVLQGIIPIAGGIITAISALFMITAIKMSSQVFKFDASKEISLSSTQNVSQHLRSAYSSQEVSTTKKMSLEIGSNFICSRSTCKDLPVDRHASSKTLRHPLMSMSGKKAKLAKTVISINLIFVVCNFPRFMIVVSTITTLYVPDLSLFSCRPYRNWVVVINVFTMLGEAIISSANFLIYYMSSTKFRLTFREIVRASATKK